MSMISGQVDRLRTAAQTYRRLGNHSAESMLLDAADTIWQLRDDLQRANAENAKLREQIHWLKQGDILHVLTDQEYIDQCERERLMQVSIDALDKENAKLRELAADMREAFIHGNCYRWCEFKEPCDGKCQYIDRMRGLGVVE
jgi:hypothetical protein